MDTGQGMHTSSPPEASSETPADPSAIPVGPNYFFLHSVESLREEVHLACLQLLEVLSLLSLELAEHRDVRQEATRTSFLCQYFHNLIA